MILSSQPSSSKSPSSSPSGAIPLTGHKVGGGFCVPATLIQLPPLSFHKHHHHHHRQNHFAPKLPPSWLPALSSKSSITFSSSKLSSQFLPFPCSLKCELWCSWMSGEYKKERKSKKNSSTINPVKNYVVSFCKSEVVPRFLLLL